MCAFRGFVFLNEELLIMELAVEEPPSFQLKKSRYANHNS